MIATAFLVSSILLAVTGDGELLLRQQANARAVTESIAKAAPGWAVKANKTVDGAIYIQMGEARQEDDREADLSGRSVADVSRRMFIIVKQSATDEEAKTTLRRMVRQVSTKWSERREAESEELYAWNGEGTSALLLLRRNDLVLSINGIPPGQSDKVLGAVLEALRVQ